MLTGAVELTETIIGCAIEVHRHTGPGLLESVYDACLQIELNAAGLPFRRQVIVPALYKGKDVGGALRLDYLVDDQVVVEIKSLERLLPVHQAQVLTYLRLARKPIGLLINFNVPVLRHGVRRLVLTVPDTSAPPCLL